mmetsp:Transcript_12173/g.13987  ORF Transcript_12173/g.13987 Transcript_12173/m.13987 type:complete len:429 (+) Transcript_12173:270-1556(+)
MKMESQFRMDGLNFDKVSTIGIDSNRYITEPPFNSKKLSGGLRVGKLKPEKLKENLNGIFHLLVYDNESLEYDEEVERVRYQFEVGSPISDQPYPEIALEDAGRDGVNFMMIHDGAGMTIVVNDRCYEILSKAGVAQNMEWAPNKWNAIELTPGAGEEDPKIVSHVSSVLSENAISILNFTTFNSDLVLIQDIQMEEAEKIFENFRKTGLTEMLHGAKDESLNKNFLSWKTHPSVSLRQLPKKLRFNRVEPEYLRSCSFAIMRQILKNIDGDVSPLPMSAGGRRHLHIVDDSDENADEETAELSASGQQTTQSQSETYDAANDFFWAYLSYENEISLVCEADDMKYFPEVAITSLERNYMGIKLCGDDIAFSQTGVVKLMSKPLETGIDVLNISTYATNVSLVKVTEVSEAMKYIQDELNRDKPENES